MQRSMMRALSSRGLVGLALFVAACDDGGGGHPVDAAVGGDAQGAGDAPSAVDTSGASDGGASDATKDAAVLVPPPSLTAPTPGAHVFFSVDVAGASEANAAFQVKLTVNGQTVGTAHGTVDAKGALAVTVPYTGAVHGNDIDVEVTVFTAAGPSVAKIVVTHWAPQTLNVTIAQSSGPVTGEDVYVRLYKSDQDSALPAWVDEQKIKVVANQLVNGRVVSFRVPDGTFSLRAFRDSGGKGNAPDGQPSLGPDAQSKGTSVTVPAALVANLDLKATPALVDGYVGFDVRTFNSSALAAPPSIRQGKLLVIGPGLCGGYFLDMATFRIGNPARVSQPYVRLPDRRVVALQDDGGCGDAKHDNSLSSYDDKAGDGAFRYGIADPTEGQAGTYVFAFRQVVDDFIHIETDNIATVKKLPLLREVVNPDNSKTVSTLRPVVTWRPVPGAVAYDVTMGNQGGAWNNLADPAKVVTQPAYQPTMAMTDDTCYSLFIAAYDAAPPADIDAIAWSEISAFCIDTDQQNSMVLSGKITNNTKQDVPVVVRAQTSQLAEFGAVLRLPSGATSYRLAMLRGSDVAGGKVDGFLDRDATGSSASLGNQGYEAHYDKVDFTKDATMDVTFNPRVVAVSPVWFDRVPASPKFAWEDYAVSAGAAKPKGPFSYVLWMSSESTGLPPTIFILPSSATSIDLAAVPPPAQAFDVVPLATCLENKGSFSTDPTGLPICTGGASIPSTTTLQKSVLYFWSLSVIECDFATLKHPAKAPPTAGADPFLTCVINLLTNNGAFASSAYTPFEMQD